MERRHLEAADQLLAVLGTMKGPIMKVGQLLSFVDMGVFPEEVRPRFQQRLTALCAEAPEIPWKRMEPVVTDILGGPISGFFREFDPQPVGTASIGQVYRAVTLDGRSVAVKVQYPEIVAAARADLKNLNMVLRFAQTWAPSLDTSALAQELATRFIEELDYELEARNTDRIARAYAGHPFIAVPAPVLTLCRPRMLVTDFVDGTDFDGLAARSQDDRNRVGEAVLRFHVGGAFRHGLFSGDPHPGNLRLLDDGRVAFLDFGSTRQLAPSEVVFITRTISHILDGDVGALIAELTEAGVLNRPDVVTREALGAYLADSLGWCLDDEVVTMTPAYASDAILASIVPSNDHQGMLSGQDLPVEWAMLIRALITTSALLGQFSATANWHRIMREWSGGDPATPLGELEAAFYAGS